MVRGAQRLRGVPRWRRVFCLVIVGLGLGGCELLRWRIPRSPHLLLGNPSRARTDVGLPTNYLMLKPQFALSYNRDRGIPNWVSWQLNSSWLGVVDRQNNFRGDPDLPVEWLKIEPPDYFDGSKKPSRRYDRGHLVPSADRTRSALDNGATFVMTNVLPQTAANNRGPWQDLELYCRRLAQQGRELYIVAGGLGQQGRLNGKIVIPSSVWKVVLVLEQPGLGLAGVTEKTRVIAVNVPNTHGVADQPWRRYRLSVDGLEQLTGYDFLSNLDPALEALLEARVDAGPIGE